MFDSIKQLLNRDIKIGLIYSLGDFIVIGSRFILFLIYGSILTSAEYGMFAVLTAISTVVGILLTMGLKAAAFKHYFDYPTLREKQSYYSTLWFFLTIGSAVLTIIIGFLWGKIPFPILLNVPLDPYIKIALWSSYFSNVYSLVAFEILRASRKPSLFIALAIGNATTLIVFAIIFVYFLGLGVIGSLLTTLITGILWAFIYTHSLRQLLRFTFSIQKLKNALTYSLPFIPHFLSHWLLNFSDRIILEQSVSLDNVGVYSLGYNFGTAQQVVANSGNNAIMPYYGRAAKDESYFDRIPKLNSTYISIMALFALGISIFSDEMIHWFFSESYSQSADIVFWIALGFFSIALYYGPMNTITLIAGKSKFIWVITLIAGLVNILLNLLLIPHFGIIAAAINTLIGYVLMFILIFFYSLKLSPMKYEFKRLIFVVSGLLIGIAVDKLLNPQAISGEIGLDSFIFLIYAFLVYQTNMSSPLGDNYD